MSRHLLALETSTSVCDVAVLSRLDGQVRVWTASHEGVREHAQRLIPLVDQALAAAGVTRRELGLIAFGQGPGAFTGLRVACGVAQGMAFGLGLPVVVVPSLLAIAARAAADEDVNVAASRSGAAAVHLVMQDARMGEVYLAAYGVPAAPAQAWKVLQAPMLIDAGQVALWLDEFAGRTDPGGSVEILVSGDALDAYPELARLRHPLMGLRTGQTRRADAATVARLALAAWDRGDTLAAHQATPLYVRDRVAYTTAERQQGAGGNPRAPDYSLQILPMTPAHLDAVAAIESRIQSFPWTRRSFAEGLSAGYSAWVACAGDQVVGFCMAMMAPDVAHLLVIGVAPDYQGKGVGTLLLHQCEATARAHDLDVIVLEVRDSNRRAQAFYERHGFVLLSTRSAYYPVSRGQREDARVLKKRLPPAGESHE